MGRIWPSAPQSLSHTMAAKRLAEGNYVDQSQQCCSAQRGKKLGGIDVELSQNALQSALGDLPLA